MKALKRISLLFLGIFIVVPLAYASAVYTPLKKTGGSKWLLNKAVVTIVDVPGHTITATKGSSTYAIDFANAKIIRKYNASADVSEVLVGDYIQVFGVINGTNVTAKKVRDLSIQRANGKFNGTIKSISTDPLVKTFVLQSNHRGDQTVTVSDTTKIRYKGAAKTFADLAVGNRIIVTGVWNSTHKTVYSVTSIKITKK